MGVEQGPAGVYVQWQAGGKDNAIRTNEAGIFTSDTTQVD
jgi:hypothetical protein